MKVLAEANFYQVSPPFEGEKVYRTLELCGRTAYKSVSDNVDSHREFVKMILKSGHESVLEHFSVSILVICDRGVSHEIVRHRIASYTQESTRYCNYSKDKFGGEITVIRPPELEPTTYDVWFHAMKSAEKAYMLLLEMGVSPQIARSVLPISLKTEIVMTMNLREWRYFLKLRNGVRAHPQMKEVASMILTYFKEKLPLIFSDIQEE